MFTEKELTIMSRIIGHHVTGTEVDELYEKLLRLVPDSKNMGPFEKTCNHPYGDRPMIDVRGS